MDKEIFFHVGLSKTASTYLQNRFFNKIDGIYYIGNNNYKKYRSIIESSDAPKILVSREFDRLFDLELEKFAKFYPQAKIIMVLRKHGSWMASQYRRYVKNGGKRDFEYFFDIENNSGLWDIKEAFFYSKIQKIENLFANKPLILFYEDLKQNPVIFFDQIAEFLNCSYDIKKVNLTSKHKSYSEKQLKIQKKLNKIFKNDLRSRNFFLSKGRWILCHIFLFFSFIIPEFLAPKKNLINKKSIENVDDFYQNDWQKCIDYTKTNSL